MSYEMLEGMVLAFAIFLLGILGGCVLALFWLKPDEDDGWNPWDDFDKSPDPEPSGAKR